MNPSESQKSFTSPLGPTMNVYVNTTKPSTCHLNEKCLLEKVAYENCIELHQTTKPCINEGKSYFMCKIVNLLVDDRSS
jgi:hypothetical protein